MASTFIRDVSLLAAVFVAVLLVAGYLVFGGLHVVTRFVRWLFPHRRV